MDLHPAALEAQRIDDAATWRAFAPALHVEHAPLLAARAPLPIPAASALSRRLTIEGYLQQDPPEWGLPIAAMAEIVGALAARGLPPVLAFHYDEFWLLFARMRALIAAILGPDFAMLPNFWAWHVDPAGQGAGWSPHRDHGRASLFADNTPKSLTVWLPLTDATPLNGCIYLVPADRDPTYNTEDEQSLRFQLSDIRALPARAGSILAWTQAVIHWGARSAPPAAGRPATPRVSLSCEFQRADQPAFATPLLDPQHPPDFVQRQRLIGALILRYRHMHTLTPEIEALATRLSQRGAALPAGQQARQPVELVYG